MPKVVPSQVVSLIDQSYGFPPLKEDYENLDLNHAPTLQAIGDLIDQIPVELITLQAADYNALSVCRASMKYWVSNWMIRGTSGVLRSVKGYQGKHILALVRSLLEKCPDEAPAPQTVGLEFIADLEYREQLRTDISTAFAAERNGEWKSATVIAGSVVESLLLWALQELDRQQLIVAVSKARGEGFQINAASSPENWTLAQYIEIAKRLKLINEDTVAQAKLTQDFRNLIHPGRAIRLGQKCNRATALSALAGIEHVVNDLR